MLKSLKGALQRKIQFRFHNVQWGKQSLEPTLLRNIFQASSSEEDWRLDCKTVGFFLKISKEIGKAWRKSLTRAKRASLTLLSLSVFSLVRDLLFDCSRVLEYAKIRTVLQSTSCLLYTSPSPRD